VIVAAAALVGALVLTRLGYPRFITTQVVAALASHLHQLGFAVRAPLLAGHGRSLAALRHVSSDEWHAEARREYEDLHAKHSPCAVVGLSMGGALAITLAAQQRDVAALVLLAPYVAMPATLGILARTSGAWGWLLPYFSSRGKRSIHDPAAAKRALGHGVFTPEALRALAEVQREATRNLPEVAAPTLVIQSREDNRISQRRAAAAFDLVGARTKEMLWVEGAGHVITVDYGYERVFDATSQWLLRYTQKVAEKTRGR
jgi:carboxylesterase